jgi:hypothetical protein
MGGEYGHEGSRGFAAGGQGYVSGQMRRQRFGGQSGQAQGDWQGTSRGGGQSGQLGSGAQRSRQNAGGQSGWQGFRAQGESQWFDDRNRQQGRQSGGQHWYDSPYRQY